jgi:hypothetical protein
MAGEGSPEGAGAGPLTFLPEGWINIPRRGTDAWMGVYIDRKTGAMVSYAIGRMAGTYVNAYKDAPKETGTVTSLGLTYQLVRIPNARPRHVTRLRQEIGPSFDRVASYAELVPPPTSAEVVVSVRAEAFSYNFTAWVCGDEEEGRIRELLLGQKALLTEEPDENLMVEKGAEARSCEVVQKGASLESALNTLGMPDSVFRPRCGVPALFYRVSVRGKPGSCQLEFDRNQQLEKKAVR